MTCIWGAILGTFRLGKGSRRRGEPRAGDGIGEGMGEGMGELMSTPKAESSGRLTLNSGVWEPPGGARPLLSPPSLFCLALARSVPRWILRFRWFFPFVKSIFITRASSSFFAIVSKLSFGSSACRIFGESTAVRSTSSWLSTFHVSVRKALGGMSCLDRRAFIASYCLTCYMIITMMITMMLLMLMVMVMATLMMMLTIMIAIT